MNYKRKKSPETKDGIVTLYKKTKKRRGWGGSCDFLSPASVRVDPGTHNKDDANTHNP